MKKGIFVLFSALFCVLSACGGKTERSRSCSVSRKRWIWTCPAGRWSDLRTATAAFTGTD